MTIETIEMRLKAINGDALHRLGDHYLFYDGGREYESIVPVGQAEGKQKASRGTPDTKIKLKNGKYIFIQYTSQENEPNKKAFYKKLSGDLKACFNPEKTSIPPEQIGYIVLFFNSNLNEETENKLRKISAEYGVPLKFYNLTTIAHNIYKYYDYLAQDYLNLEIGTYQILPLEKFISEYEKGGMATPLSNPFYHRQNELDEVKKRIDNNMITIINGKSGVGKSKLVVEVIKQYSIEHPDYECFCITNKNLPIIKDLRKKLSGKKHTLLFIDDANKSISLLREVFTWYAEQNLELKIILTVRDYVYRQILQHVEKYSNATFPLANFTDNEILKIIASHPFDIKDASYQSKIIELSKGNARLAVMAAIACKGKPIEVLDNVVALYDSYFKRVSGDNPLLQDPEYLKVLGILSFFQAVDRDNRAESEKISNAFSIEEGDFWSKIYELDKDEIVNVFSDRSTVKFTDQILEIYIFYKTFLTDGLLSYSLVLKEFYPDFRGRIKYIATDGKNTFGEADFETKLLPYVKTGYTELQNRNANQFEYFQTFHAFLPDETLNFIYAKISEMPVQLPLNLQNEVRDGNAHRKVFVFEGGKTIEQHKTDRFFSLIIEFLKQFTPNFEVALELAFDYIERKQDIAEKFIEFVTGYVAFSVEDENTGFEKEYAFSVELVKRVASGHPIHTYIFLRLAPHFLKTTFFYHVNYRGSAVGKSSYKLIEKVIAIRALHWSTFNKIFENFRLLSLYTLDNIVSGLSLNDHHLLRKSDWGALEDIFDEHLNMEIFVDAFMVNKIIKDLTHGKKSSEIYRRYLKKADTKEYKWFKVLDFTLVRNREIQKKDNESYSDFRLRFNRLKEKEILKVFRCKSVEDYIPVFDLMGDCVLHNIWDFYYSTQAAHVLLGNLLKTGELQLFAELFSVIIEKPYFFKIVRYDIIFEMIQAVGHDLLNEVETVIFSKEYVNSSYVRIGFFDALKEHNINFARLERFKKTLTALEGNFYLRFSNVSSYCKLERNFLKDILTALLARQERDFFSFDLEADFIIKEYALFNSKSLAEELYLYMSKENKNHDHEGQTLAFLINLNEQFLNQYVEEIISEFYEKEDYDELKCLWELPKFLEYITVVVDRIATHNSYLLRGERVIEDLFIFSSHVDVIDNKRTAFFQYYIRKNHSDEKKMKACFRLILSKFSPQLDIFLRLFLEENPEIEMFKKIRWTERGLIIRSGNSILGEIDERIWTKIKTIVEDMSPKVKFLQHREFINRQIDYCRKNANAERKHDFLRNR